MTEAVGNATKYSFVDCVCHENISAVRETKAKRSAKQLQFIVIDALACFYCFNASFAGKSNLIYSRRRKRSYSGLLLTAADNFV